LIALSAKLYDGQTSGHRAVKVKLTVPGYIVLQELGTLSRYRLEDVEISEQLGTQPARVNLPDGSLLEIDDSETFYGDLQGGLQNAEGHGQWLHSLESRWPLATLALLLTIGFCWLAYVWGIPTAARVIAYSMPAEIDRAIGEEGLAILDERVFAPTELDPQRQLQLLAEFMSVVATVGEGDDYRYQLVFRKGQELGANAIALPAGTIVITDELVGLAENDDELAAVLAHEVGHVRNRHALRALIQNSLVAGSIIIFTGDASSATSLAAGIPTVLASAGYSRDFEYEADDVAKEYLVMNNIPLQRFADIIVRLDASAEDGSAPPGLLATHPDARERIRPFQ
jgi:Zn-dependent protease with chaperone function